MKNPEAYAFLDVLYEQAGGAFYILDLDKFESNVGAFCKEFRDQYNPFEIAYPYKANYLPAICSKANELGLFAEVSSGTEFQMARFYKVPETRIIVNGPFHSFYEIYSYLSSGALFVLDNREQLKTVVNYCREEPGKIIFIGIRLNFEISGNGLSRFGVAEDEISALQLEIKKVKNLKIKMLHCHFSSHDRSVSSFITRLSRLIDIYRQYFPDLECLNIGGGFFGNIPEMLKSQFSVEIPDFSSYAKGIGGKMSEITGKNPIRLLAEPGSALVADAMKLVCRSVHIKKIREKKYVITDASRQNLHPGYKQINLPLTVLGKQEGDEDTYDVTGYTCMENDILFRNFKGKIRVGDLLVFSNCGAYSYVNKPPFIRPQLPVFVFENGEVISSVAPETTKDWINRLL